MDLCVLFSQQKISPSYFPMDVVFAQFMVHPITASHYKAAMQPQTIIAITYAFGMVLFI